MIDSGHGDKTAGREGGLLKIRYANRNKNHTFSIYLKQCRAVPVHNRRTFQVLNAAASQWPRKFSGLEAATIVRSPVVFIFAEIDRRFPCRSLSPERRPIWSRRRNIQRSRCS
jgi:hypothetical protein